MAALAASYDVLLGYAGIVSFAHVMFFGIGAYGVGLALLCARPGLGRAGARARRRALALAALLALAIGLFSLRVQAIFFAMVTLAVAYAFNVLASQLPDITGGEDGRTFPRAGDPAPRLQARRMARRHAVTGRTLSYYLVFVGAAALFLDPAARRQFAVRPRAAGDPREPVSRRGARATASCSIARWRPLVAALARRSPARSTRYGCATSGPTRRCRFSIQIDVLVIVVIGGRGTLYGAVVGAAVFVIAENYLRALIGALSQAAASLGLPLLPSLLHPDRWLLWLGVLFILAVRFAPRGIVGELARRRKRRLELRLSAHRLAEALRANASACARTLSGAVPP